MKKFVLILLSVIMMFGAAACGEVGNIGRPDDTGKSGADVTATPAEIEQKIAGAIGPDNYLCDTDIEKEWLESYFGFDVSKIGAYAAKQNCISSVNPDTVIVLKVRDGYADEAVRLMNESYGQLVNYIRLYPFGTAKVMNGRIYQSGSYVIYVIAGAVYDGEDAEEEAKLANSEYAKIDDAIKSVFGTLPENQAVIPEESGSGGFEFDGNDGGSPVIGG
ncbi:MAG: DUF4358 domain-containing protein [Eubacteriales bacterium]